MGCSRRLEGEKFCDNQSKVTNKGRLVPFVFHRESNFDILFVKSFDKVARDGIEKQTTYFDKLPWNKSIEH